MSGDDTPSSKEGRKDKHEEVMKPAQNTRKKREETPKDKVGAAPENEGAT